MVVSCCDGGEKMQASGSGKVFNHFIGRFAIQMRRFAPRQNRESVCAVCQAVDGGILQRPGTRRFQGQIRCRPVQAIEYAAMANHGDRAARVRLRQPLNRSDNSGG